MQITNSNPGSKLIAALIAVSLITAAAGVIGIRNLDKSNELASSLYSRDLQATAYSRDADIFLLNSVRDQKNLLLAETNETRVASLAAGEKDKAAFLEKMEKARQVVYSARAKELLGKIGLAYPEWDRFDRRVIAATAATAPLQKQAAARLSAEGKSRIDAIQDLFIELSKVKDDNSLKTAEATSESYRSSTKLMTPFVIAGVLLAVGLGLRLRRSRYA